MINRRQRNSKYLIAVIEDDAEMSSMLEDYLGYNGFQTVCFSSALSFLESYPRSLPNLSLVITDINMPQMNGLELVHLLKKRNEKLPIALISATTSLIDIQKIKSSGADLFMQKPFQLLAVRENIESLIYKKEA